MAGGLLAAELLRRVERRVDDAAEARLWSPQCVYQLGKGDVADNQQVDVAGVALLAAGEGAEDEGES